MYIARILYPVEVLGAGKRIGIWVCGCPHRCIGCSNPELWEFNEKYNITIENLKFLIKSIAESNHIDGFTVTGGEPFYQSEELEKLLDFLIEYSDDILLYSGYTFEEITKISNHEKILDNIGVLIDGRYVRELNTGVFLRGSENQKIYFLKENLKVKYESYIKENINQIQNFTIGKEVISVGIHKPDYEDTLHKKLLNFGLEKEE